GGASVGCAPVNASSPRRTGGVVARSRAPLPTATATAPASQIARTPWMVILETWSAAVPDTRVATGAEPPPAVDPAEGGRGAQSARGRLSGGYRAAGRGRGRGSIPPLPRFAAGSRSR